MRIAMISTGCYPVLDGVSVSVHDRLRRLAEAGHETLLLAPTVAPGPGKSGLSSVEIVGLESRPWGGAAGDRNPLRRANGQIRSALEIFRPDIIHIDEPERLFLGLWQIAARTYAIRQQTPLVAFYHTNFPSYLEDGWPRAIRPLLPAAQGLAWRATAGLYNRVDVSLVPSKATLKRLQSAGLRNGIAGRFNGVDTDVFKPGRRQSGYWAGNWGLPALDGRTVLLIVGRLTPDKNWRFWRECLPALQATLGDGLAVAIAGDGVLRDQIAEWLPASHPQAHLLGRVGRDRMPGLLANSDIYATASRHENASIAVLEALATGLPVLAPATDSMAEQVENERNGLLFRADDIRACVACTEKLYRDKYMLAELHRAANATRERYSLDSAFSAWLGVLTTLANRSPALRERAS